MSWLPTVQCVIRFHSVATQTIRTLWYFLCLVTSSFQRYLVRPTGRRPMGCRGILFWRLDPHPLFQRGQASELWQLLLYRLCLTLILGSLPLGCISVSVLAPFYCWPRILCNILRLTIKSFFSSLIDTKFHIRTPKSIWSLFCKREFWQSCLSTWRPVLYGRLWYILGRWLWGFLFPPGSNWCPWSYIQDTYIYVSVMKRLNISKGRDTRITETLQ